MEGGKGFALLPREMAIKIFGLLSVEELKTCVQVYTIGSAASTASTALDCKSLKLKVCFTGVSSLVGHWKQPNALEEPHVAASQKQRKLKVVNLILQDISLQVAH